MVEISESIEMHEGTDASVCVRLRILPLITTTSSSDMRVLITYCRTDPTQKISGYQFRLENLRQLNVRGRREQQTGSVWRPASQSESLQPPPESQGRGGFG